MSTKPDTSEAVPRMDWEQVVLNGGPPCFFVEGPQYCGRAERWERHGNPAFHDFVSLEQMLSGIALSGVCVYCNEVAQYESLEQKMGAEGNLMRVEHIRKCAARPELKLIAELEKAWAELATRSTSPSPAVEALKVVVEKLVNIHMDVRDTQEHEWEEEKLVVEARAALSAYEGKGEK